MKFKSNRGVTGVDVAIATIIFIIFVSFITGLFYNISSTSKKIERKSIATNIAIEVIEALKATNFVVLNDNMMTSTQVTEEQLQELTGKFIDIPNGYTVKISITNPESDDVEDSSIGETIKMIVSEVSYTIGKDVETVKIETLTKNIT